MKYYPSDKEEKSKALNELKAKHWMLKLLSLNPEYCPWSPYEHSMKKDDKGWDSRITLESWDEFCMNVDSYNEIVNFYFEIRRESVPCQICDGSSLNKETKQIYDEWYSQNSWSKKLEQEEVDFLFESGYLYPWTYFEGEEVTLREGKSKPSAEEVNASDFRIDSSAAWACIENKARRLGVLGECQECDFGKVYTQPQASIDLMLWVIHPRTCSSRGFHIKNLKKKDIKSVLELISTAAERNAERFSSAVLHYKENYA